SPDGSRLAFAEQQRNGNWTVSTMRLDGSDRKLLTDRRLSSQDPAWSPDAKKIAVVVQEDALDSIAIVDASWRHTRAHHSAVACRRDQSELVSRRPQDRFRRPPGGTAATYAWPPSLKHANPEHPARVSRLEALLKKRMKSSTHRSEHSSCSPPSKQSS
ncbi:MAG: TolB family protein, partial [Solirubrobacterales bacterium]